MIIDTASQILLQEEDNPSTSNRISISELNSFDQEAISLAAGLVILAGRPSICHETLAKYISLKASMDGNREVVWFSSAFSGPYLIKEFLKQGCSHQYLAASNNFTIVDSPRLSVDLIRRGLNRIIPERLSSQGLVIIDDLEGLLFSSLQEGSSESRIAGRLRSLALERNCTLLVRCYLSRKLEYRKYKQPRLSDLSEFRHSVIEADQILAIHYPYIYSEEEPENQWEIYILKNRSGMCTRHCFPVAISTLISKIGGSWE